MKINKYWSLGNDLYPRRNIYCIALTTKEKYDSVCIIHFGKHFRPIVLDKKGVISINRWQIKRFYRGVNKAISVANFGGSLKEDYWIEKCGKIKVRWGCRTFTHKQLLIIKKAMEEHYGKERLGK